MAAFGLNTDGRGDVVAQARRAEELGFDSFGVGEHVFFHYPTTNALIALAGAATVTCRIRLLASVALLPLYPAALLAKMVTALDHLSGGRFDLGVGVGGEYPAEFEACGVSTTDRGARADEALDLMRCLWTGEPTRFYGRFARIDGEVLTPPPVQPGGPPIWVAGRSRAALRRAITYGDGWMPYFRSPASLVTDIADMHTMAKEAGRDPATIRVGVVVFTCVHDDRTVARRMISDRLAANYAGDYSAIVDRLAAAGPPQGCAKVVEQYLESGADTVFFATLSDECHAEESERRLAQEVLPHFRSTT